MERMGAVHDARAVGGAAREFDRGLDALGAGVGKEHLVEIRHIFEQLLGEHTRQRRDVELHQIGQVGVEHALERFAQRRMIAANRKNAEPAQQVEITRAVAVEQILALPLLKTDIIADRLQDAHQLLVEITSMHGTALRLAVHKHLGNV